jgi:hypothetical protein
MAAYLALLMIEVCFTQRVHMVFLNNYLMERDQRAFSFYWNYLKDRVQFHVGLDSFEPKENEVVIVDEADYFIYADMQAFLNKTKSMPTICFTATIDNGTEDGVERELLDLAKFKICETYEGTE